MKNKNTKWFKPKPFIHFSSKIYTEDFSWLSHHVSDPTKIESHPFFPLIHKVIAQRKFRRNRNIDDGKRIKGETKIRHIYYASHLDSHIYAYYAKILGEKFESHLAEDPQLSNCILAYRTIPKPGSTKNKSNLDFAFEVFTYIKNQQTDCVALTFDIKNFFDELDHGLLKRNWSLLLDSQNLNDDHYHIYKSLTEFRYIEESDVLKFLKLKHANDLRRLKTQKFFQSKTFRDFINQHGIIKKNERINSDKKLIGIPQGTALSAFLSNIYLYFFDKEVYKFVVQERNGLYRRYSDDIVIVLAPQYGKEAEEFIYKKIIEYKLIIQPAKTEFVEFEKDSDGFSCKNKPLNYLGFQFNGKKILLKPSSLSKYFRSIKITVKLLAKRASKSSKGKRVFRKKIFKLSHLGKRNFYNYALRASALMDNDQELAIKKQVKNHWQIIHRELRKRENKIRRKKYITKTDRK